MRRRETGSGEADHGPRIGLFGRLGCGNIGNDATFEAMLGFLARELPTAELDCMCSGPGTVTERYGMPATPLHWLNSAPRARSPLLRAALTVPRIAFGLVADACRTASWVSRHDAVVIPGMGVLESTLPQRPWQLPYSLFLLSWFGRLSGTKVAFVCVGANVVRQRMTGRLLATAAKRAHYRSFRDDYSRDAARAMGIGDGHDEVFPDLVFALPRPSTPPASRGTVGVGVMAYSGGPEDRHRAEEVHAEYVGRITQFVQWLVDSGRPVRLLVGDPVDESVAQTVRDAVSASSASDAPAVTYEPISSTAGLMSQMAPLDAVVATRYHNVLVALMCAKPTIAIGYGRKHDALMSSMGVGEFVLDARSLDVEQLKKQFTVLERDGEDLARTLAERNQTNRALLRRQFALLAALLSAAGRRAKSAVR